MLDQMFSLSFPDDTLRRDKRDSGELDIYKIIIQYNQPQKDFYSKSNIKKKIPENICCIYNLIFIV